ncbi:MAG: VWA domain-containing protein, partial [Myxococcales bacterium]|nr:VWA domain-containing protein [Myxococcales bacterium]
MKIDTRSLPLALALALPFAGFAGCEKPKQETEEPSPPPVAGEPEKAPEGEPEKAPPLVDAWYNDVDADGVPDFVELELHNDPKIDECIVTACGEKARGGELAERINTLIIIDASGSMAGKAGKKKKMDAAKAAVQRFVDVMPKVDVMSVGVMAFGHIGDNTEAKKDESCSQVQMIAPMAAPDSKAVAAALKPLKPTGWSPIARSLEASTQFLPEQIGSINHIILVADGIERCDGDPVTVARQLFETNHLTVIDVVGFGIEANEDREALKAIAATTGGRYVDAATAADFDQAF